LDVFWTGSANRRGQRADLTFGDIGGKLQVLLIECTRCQRKGRYSVAKLIAQYRFIGDPLVEVGTDDHLRHPSIGSRSEPISDAGIHVPATDFKIGDSIDVVLLVVERDEVP
jgi:hypothetical protein